MKKTHIAALIFVVIAVGAIISTVYKADTYATFRIAREHQGRDFQIIGELVKDHPVEENIINTTLVMTFFMRDKNGEVMKVLYPGSKPHDFEKSDQIVLMGRFEEDVFTARDLLLKCPSKYNQEGIGKSQS